MDKIRRLRPADLADFRRLRRIGGVPSVRFYPLGVFRGEIANARSRLTRAGLLYDVRAAGPDLIRPLRTHLGHSHTIQSQALSASVYATRPTTRRWRQDAKWRILPMLNDDKGGRECDSRVK